jgi:hypothetical protein
MTKTPFEIRFDMVQMAQNQLQNEYYAKLEQAREIQNAELREAAIKELKYPCKEDILFLAEELKAFIDKK